MATEAHAGDDVDKVAEYMKVMVKKSGDFIPNRRRLVGGRLSAATDDRMAMR